MCLLRFKPQTHGRIAVFRPVESGGKQIAVLSIPEQFIAATAEDITQLEQSMMRSALYRHTKEAAPSLGSADKSQPRSPLPDKEAYTLAEVGELMGFSRPTVAALFKDEPGVIRLGHDETMHKRKYHSIRIPRPVFERALRSMTV